MKHKYLLPSSQQLAMCLHLRQISTVHDLSKYFFNIRISIIIPSTPTSFKWAFPLEFLH
jgi:hypothetical protein